MIGTASRSAGGVSIAPRFIELPAGQEIPVEPVWIPDQGDVQEAARAIVAQLAPPPRSALPWLLSFVALLVLGLRWARRGGSRAKRPGAGPVRGGLKDPDLARPPPESL